MCAREGGVAVSEIKVAFWNLQNLFDTTPSEIAADLGFLPEDGWTPAVFERKLANLAAVIRTMHGGAMPDLLGLCEIENEELAWQLARAAGRDDYEVAHDEAPDLRGIDTSLLYSRDVFELAGDPIGHAVHLRYRTRDIFQVPLRVRETGAELVVFVNHWPSRKGGVYESEPFRLAVANHAGRLVDRVLTFDRQEFLALPDTKESLERLNERWNRNVLLMGDLNDEPYSRSVLDFLQASSGLDHLEEPIRASGGRHLPAAKSYLQKQAYLYNPMWRLLTEPDRGTHYYSGSTNTMNMLDQFIVSRGLTYGLQGLRLAPGSVSIHTPALMTTRTGRPVPFEFDRRGVTRNGYSDHFAIQAVLETTG